MRDDENQTAPGRYVNAPRDGENVVPRERVRQNDAYYIEHGRALHLDNLREVPKPDMIDVSADARRVTQLREQTDDLVPSRGTYLHIDQRAVPYRPWREELMVSAAKATGSIVAMPFRLLEGLMSAILGVFAGLFKWVAILTILFLGSQAYVYARSHHGASNGDIAYTIGAGAASTIGNLMSGAWHGIFGGGHTPTSVRADGVEAADGSSAAATNDPARPPWTNHSRPHHKPAAD